MYIKFDFLLLLALSALSTYILFKSFHLHLDSHLFGLIPSITVFPSFPRDPFSLHLTIYSCGI